MTDATPQLKKRFEIHRVLISVKFQKYLTIVF